MVRCWFTTPRACTAAGGRGRDRGRGVVGQRDRRDRHAATGSPRAPGTSPGSCRRHRASIPTASCAPTASRRRRRPLLASQGGRPRGRGQTRRAHTGPRRGHRTNRPARRGRQRGHRDGRRLCCDSPRRAPLQLGVLVEVTGERATKAGCHFGSVDPGVAHSPCPAGRLATGILGEAQGPVIGCGCSARAVRNRDRSVSFDVDDGSAAEFRVATTPIRRLRRARCLVETPASWARRRAETGPEGYRAASDGAYVLVVAPRWSRRCGDQDGGDNPIGGYDSPGPRCLLGRSRSRISRRPDGTASGSARAPWSGLLSRTRTGVGPLVLSPSFFGSTHPRLDAAVRDAVLAAAVFEVRGASSREPSELDGTLLELVYVPMHPVRVAVRTCFRRQRVGWISVDARVAGSLRSRREQLTLATVHRSCSTPGARTPRW